MNPTKSSPGGFEVSSVKHMPLVLIFRCSGGGEGSDPTMAEWSTHWTDQIQKRRGGGAPPPNANTSGCSGGSGGAEQQGAALANGGCYWTRLILGVRVTGGREECVRRTKGEEGGGGGCWRYREERGK